METLVNMLNTYRGRDRVLRTSSYACLLMSGITKGNCQERLCILGTELSSCRTLLRLFDDVIMLNYNMKYNFGLQEKDWVSRWLSVLINLSDQLFYPVEHIAWAADKQILRINSSPWWYSSTFLWFLSLYFNILKTLRTLLHLRSKKKALLKMKNASDQIQSLLEVQQMMRIEVLSLIEYGADLCNAVHWLPTHFLWGGKLKMWHVGLLGLISSIIGSYKMLKLS